MKKITTGTLPGANAESVATVERRLSSMIGERSFKLPSEYRDFVINNNGGAPDKPHYPGRDGVLSFTIHRFLSVTERDTNIVSHWGYLQAIGHKHMIPIAITTMGARIAYDVNEMDADVGSLYHISTTGDVSFIVSSLSELLGELTTLFNSKYKAMSIEEIREDAYNLTLEEWGDKPITASDFQYKRKGFWGKVKSFLVSRKDYLESIELISSSWYRLANLTDYRDVYRQRVMIPPGLSKSYLDYIELLKEQKDIALMIHTEVLGPYSRYLGRLVNNPELLLSGRSGTILKEIMDIDLDGAKKRHAKAYGDKHKEHALYSDMIGSQREWPIIAANFNDVASSIAKIDREKILISVDECSGYLDDIMDVLDDMVSNGNDANKVAIDEVTQLSYLVSEHVEQFSMLVYNLRALRTSIEAAALVSVRSSISTSGKKAANIVKSSEMMNTGSPVSNSKIDRAEKNLNTTFTDDYRGFISEVGYVRMVLGRSNGDGDVSYIEAIICGLTDDGSRKDVVNVDVVTERVKKDGYRINKGEWVIEDIANVDDVVVCDPKGNLHSITKEKRYPLDTTFNGYVGAYSSLGL